MASATVLTQKDRAVLGALFDPEASLTNNTAIITSTNLSTTTTNSIPQHIKTAEQIAITSLNTPSPSESAIALAITTLRDIINTHLTYASAYNNRAQASRLLPSALTTPSTTQSIFTDLATAIKLSTPKSPLVPISSDDARVLASAHTHRGYLLLRASSDPSFHDLVLPLDLGLTCSREPAGLEEAASRDFAIAGRYGNKTAQTLAVKTNPYAKLCGQIVKEALQREITEFYEVAS